MTVKTSLTQTLTIQSLENGDRLTRAEFERRYNLMPDVKKAELIEGVVYMGSPVRQKNHSIPNGSMVGWLVVYQIATPGVEFGDNGTVILDADNEVQPDGFLRVEVGGQSILNEKDYVEGAPELIVEISASTASYDLHDKKNVYRRSGVKEYLVWRVRDGAFDWFRLQEGKYVGVEPEADGIIRSQVFPGLWLDKSALLAGNLAKVFEVLQQGIATSEHQAFVDKLAAASAAESE